MIAANELPTAIGSAFGWYAQVRVTFLPLILPSFSWVVSASAIAWHGCQSADSMLMTGTFEYFRKELITGSAMSSSYDFSPGNDRTAIASTYRESTCAASLMCSVLSWS